MESSSKESLVELLNRIKETQSKVEETTPVPLRFRPPYLQTNTHDARGDAAHLAIEHMQQRGIPLWATYLLSESFVNAYSEELHTKYVSFVDNQYVTIDATVWCKEVLKKLEEYLTQLSVSPESVPDFPSEWNHFPYAFCSQKNRKPKMEDRHVLLPYLGIFDRTTSQRHNEAFFAVFDGHHGSECALYASAHFHRCLLEVTAESEEELQKKTYELFNKRLTLRCEKENIRSGTTAACVYLKGPTAYLSWCGDSSIGVLRPDSIETLSRRHLPDDPVEKKRIEDAGGVVISIQGEPRVNGVLNISRALGDIQARPMVSSEPELRAYTMGENDLILFLSSDGIWDTLSEAELYDYVRAFIGSQSSNKFADLATFIAEKAKEEGASDNLTLIAVLLKPVEEVWRKLAAKS